MKLLFISHLYPNSLEPGKAPFHRGLVNALAQQATVEVIAPVFRRPGRKLPPEEEIIDGVTVRHPRIWYVPGVFVHQHWRMYLASIRRYLRTSAFAGPTKPWRSRIGGFKPDHVLIGYLYPDGTAVGSLCRELGIPYSIRVAGSDFRLRYNQPKFRKIILKTLQDAPLIFTHGEALKRDIAATGIEDQKLVAVQNGVDHDKFKYRTRKEAQKVLNEIADAPLASRVFEGQDGRRSYFVESPGLAAADVSTETGDHDKVILFAGNLVDVKGPDRLLAAFARLQERKGHGAEGDDYQLFVAGDGPMRKQLVRLADDLNIADHVHFMGSRPHGEIAYWMNVADCLVLPSRSEGTPNVVLEALCSGLPVVATDVGECSCLLEGEQGSRIVKDSNSLKGQTEDGISRGISLAIREVFNKDIDREAMAAGCRNRFLWHNAVDTILARISTNSPSL